MIALNISLGLVFLAAAFFAWKFHRKFEEANQKLKKDLSLRKSREVLFGQSAEKIAPFLDEFGFDPRDSQFLGQPIDYVVFNEDEVCFVEIKTGKAKLTQKQKKIKKLIEEKKVNWKELRI